MKNYTRENLEKFASLCQIYFGDEVSYEFVACELRVYCAMNTSHAKEQSMDEYLKDRLAHHRRMEEMAIERRRIQRMTIYDRSLLNHPLRKEILATFVEDVSGHALYQALTTLWSIKADDFKPCVVYFAEKNGFSLDSVNLFYHERAHVLSGFGRAVTADGERAFNALIWAINDFVGFCKQP